MFRFSKRLFPSTEVHKAGVKLATTLIKNKDTKIARKILEDVLRYEPNNTDVLNNIAFLMGEDGDWDKAEGYLRRAIDTQKPCPECHNNLGNVLVREGKHQEAKGEFEKAIKMEPKYVDAHLNLALLLEDLNDWGGALESYKKAYLLVQDPEMKKMIELRSTWMEEIGEGKRTIASHH
jgi:Tfp pilus assembly protein PilF